MQGDDVALLQQELKQAGRKVDAAEETMKLYGKTTYDAVRQIQQQAGLTASGVVNQSTATAVTTARAGDAPGTAAAPSLPAVAAPGAGAPKAGTPGYGRLPVTASMVASAASPWAAQAISLPTDAVACVVSGAVISPDNAAPSGLPARLVDKNAGPDVVLAQGVTGTAGEYTFQVQVPVKFLLERHKTRPDLQVQVLRGDTVAGGSAVWYNASGQKTLDVILPPGLSWLPSEYETLTADIARFYTGPLGGLREDGERQDVTYLAGKSGWDARAIAMASLADQFSQQRPAGPGHPTATAQGAGIHPAFYYALFRAGFPADADALSRVSPSVLAQIWEQAAAQGVIPGSSPVRPAWRWSISSPWRSAGR